MPLPLESQRNSKRILLKISGEMLGSTTEKEVFSSKIFESLSTELDFALKQKQEIAIVIGGGNFYRGAQGAPFIERTTGDHIGMLATIMNALALADCLRTKKILVHIQSPFTTSAPVGKIDIARAKQALKRQEIVIFAGGTGNPFFSTDSAAILRAIEIGASVALKATKVDGIFSSDPKKDKTAKKYDILSFEEAFEKKLKVMDWTAFALSQEFQMPICVFNILKAQQLRKALMGEKIGTWVGQQRTSSLCC